MYQGRVYHCKRFKARPLPFAAVEYTLAWGSTPPDLSITTSGRAEVTVFARYLDEVFSDPRFRPGLAVLVDHSQLDMSPLTSENVRVIAEHVISRDDRIGKATVALLTATPVAFGLARMWQAYAESVQLHSRVFWSRDEALDWLRDQRPASL